MKREWLMSTEDSRLHKLYRELPKDQYDAVENATRAVMQMLQNDGFSTAFDDRAECLVGAITRYFLASQGE